MRENGIGEFLALGCGLASRLPGGVHRVLRLNGADNFRNGDAQFRQLVRLYPKSHRVLARSKYLNVADARRARDRVGDIDVRVVGEKVGIVGSMR